MATKEQHRVKLLDYLSNPSNDWPNRDHLASDVLHVAVSTLYHHFSPQELMEIERDALQLRRQRYSPHLSKVDNKLLDNAARGDTQAAKLMYDRLEGLPVKRVVIGISKDEPPRIILTIHRKSESRF